MSLDSSKYLISPRVSPELSGQTRFSKAISLSYTFRLLKIDEYLQLFPKMDKLRKVIFEVTNIGENMLSQFVTVRFGLLCKMQLNAIIMRDTFG